MGARAARPWRPETVHAAIAFTVALTLALGLWLLAVRLLPPSLRPEGVTVAKALAAWLAGVNVTAFAYYGFDKGRARKGGRRVPEAVLHGLAVAGGSIGAYAGMRVFRHKTVKGQFRLLFWIIVVFQVLLVAWLVWHLWHR
jgi:uncharacterized membrane protein YsdA (DUF1294 family)